MRKEKFRTTKGFEYLTKWILDGKLGIDYQAANDFAFKDFQLKDKYPELREVDYKNNTVKDHYTQFSALNVNIERIKNQDFNMSVDGNIHRFHSNLTCMKSEFRNFLTYNGIRLAAVDLKNSQPYLSVKLLDPKFWFYDKYENIYKSKFDISNNIDDNLTLYKINKSLFINLFQNSTIYNCIIMCLKSVKMPINTDVASFVEYVSKGKFYELLGKEIKEKMNIVITDRKELKAIVFLVLFTSNKFIGQEKAGPKKLFMNIFPNMYKLFAVIKKRDKTILPRILQSLESHLMLKVIAKRISIERPDLPIFTIHDSIVTTVGNEDYVHNVMKEELTKHIGCPPTLDIQYWTPENMKHKTVPNKDAA